MFCRKYIPAKTNRGQVVIIATVFFLIISLTVILSISFSVVRGVRIARDLRDSRQSMVLAESLNEDLVYRLRNGMDVDESELLTVGEHTATGTIIVLSGGGREVTTTGDVDGANRRVQTVLQIGEGAAFNFGIQSGKGGIHMANTSSVRGNAFSNGHIRATQDNYIYGEAISAGPDGLVDGIHATGSVYAHSIRGTEIDGDAYYQVDGGGNTFNGGNYSGSPDQATSTFPITDSQIEALKVDAEAGGVYTSPCPYIIDDTQTIGPLKIECDLEIKKSTADVSIAGNIWVEGSLTTDVGQPTIRVDSSLGSESVAIVVDDPSNSTTSSKIDLRNGANFIDSGTDGSFIVLISQNDSAEDSGSETAIDVTQSATGDFLLYAAHGEISIAQSASLREVTAYKISLFNSAEVIYETGLASILFTSGPGGGFKITDWEEIE